MLGFGVWVHHMFATGLPIVSLSFFSAATIVITIPSDTIVQYPANTMTWGDALCGKAPLATDGTGGTGPAI